MYIQSPGKTLAQLVRNDDPKTNQTSTNALPDRAQQQRELNTALLQANANVSLSSGNESLALLYKTALEGINDSLKDTFGENAIQASYDMQTDVSPEATAERIVSQSTAIFSRYQQNNPNVEIGQALSDFNEVIRGGIEQGFNEAQDILTSLLVLEGKVASDIDATYALVQTGLNAFFDSYSLTSNAKE